nr:MAG TPA: hypothetical protein [Caudoviricetes sp.]
MKVFFFFLSFLMKILYKYIFIIRNKNMRV